MYHFMLTKSGINDIALSQLLVASVKGVVAIPI